MVVRWMVKCKFGLLY